MRYVTALAAVCAFAFPATVQAETNYQQAKRIIYATFPDTTQDAALRVVACETGGTYSPWSKNRRSGAFGYFQFIPGNHNRVITWGTQSMKVDYYRMWQPWYAARAGLLLSHGGTDWGEWDCSP